MLAFLIKTS
ncbi:hypothetical protein ECTW09195_0677, partial [Escherichia coli TW09195]